MSATELRDARRLGSLAHLLIGLGVAQRCDPRELPALGALALATALVQGRLTRGAGPARGATAASDGFRVRLQQPAGRRARGTWSDPLRWIPVALGTALLLGLSLGFGGAELVLLLQAGVLGVAWSVRARPGRTVLLGVLAPICAVLVLSVRPAPLVLVGLAPGCLAGLWSWMLVQGEATRGGAPPRRRAGVALGLLALLALPTVALYLGVSALGRRTGPLADRTQRGLEAPPPSGPREPVRSDRRARGARQASPDTFGADLSLSGGVHALSQAELMRVRVVGEPPTDLPPLHLRCVAMDAVDEDGVRSAGGLRPRVVRDGDDGLDDGWCTLDEAEPGTRVRTLEIEMRSLALEDRPWSALFAPEPLLAVELDSVGYDPDGVLVWPDRRLGTLRYGTRSVVRELGPGDLAGRRARHPDSRWTRVEGPREDLERIDEALAPALAPGRRAGRDDLGTVLALGRLLRTRCSYERAAQGFEGLLAVAEFLDRRRGHCTHFATAMVVGLRRAGIAARVVTGVLAREWSADLGGYVVRERDAHAWVEVHFEGVGWLTFDPTPAADEGELDAALGGDLLQGGELGLAELWHGFLVGDPRGLERLLWHLLTRPVVRILLILLLPPVVLLLVRSLRRGQGTAKDPDPDAPASSREGPVPEARDPLGPLGLLLESRGLARASYETLPGYLRRCGEVLPGQAPELRTLGRWADEERWDPLRPGLPPSAWSGYRALCRDLETPPPDRIAGGIPFETT